MRHELYGSLDEMLSPNSLGGLEGRPVSSVRTQPWTPPKSYASGCPFITVETSGGDGERRRYIVKQTAPAWDIVMRITGDCACRELLVWQHELLDRLPPEVGHAIVAGATDGAGWAILMRDIGDTLGSYTRWPDPGWEPLSMADTTRLLDALASLHAHFWEDPVLRDPALDLCELWWLYHSCSPAAARSEAGSPHRLVGLLRDGWQQLEALVAPDVANLVRQLQDNPRPLCNALGRYPRTLIHGDPNTQNVGIERGSSPRVMLLDWQFVAHAPPAVDLAWMLGTFAAVLPISCDEAIAQYCEHLARRLGARFDERWWRPQLELALLGDFLRQGQFALLRIARHESAAVRDQQRAMVAWWSECVRAGAKWL